MKGGGGQGRDTEGRKETEGGGGKRRLEERGVDHWLLHVFSVYNCISTLYSGL